MNKIITICVLGIVFQSCSSNVDQSSDATEYVSDSVTFSKIQNTNYEKYVLFKGDDCSGIKEVLEYRAEAYQMDWRIRTAKYNDWTVIHLDSVNEASLKEVDTDFHEVGSEFFGTPGEELIPNETQTSLAIAIDPKGRNTYIGYFDKTIFDNTPQGSCIMYAVFQNNKKFLATQCFNLAYEVGEHKVLDFDQVLKKYNIKLEDLQSDRLEWKKMHIKSKNFSNN